MPARIPKACRKIGCPKTTIDSSGYCLEHKPTESSWHKYRNGKSRQERGYGRDWERLRRIILERDRYLCQCDSCKSKKITRNATEVDHIIGKAFGGTDELTNLRAINHQCHKYKTATEKR